MWIIKALSDFFVAVGFIVTFGMIAILVFNDGQLYNFSTAWIGMPALAYAWLRGEFYHWPKERRSRP